MESLSLLEECYDMLKELENAYVRHNASIALRRKIRRFIKKVSQQETGLGVKSVSLIQVAEKKEGRHELSKL